MRRGKEGGSQGGSPIAQVLTERGPTMIQAAARFPLYGQDIMAELQHKEYWGRSLPKLTSVVTI